MPAVVSMTTVSRFPMSRFLPRTMMVTPPSCGLRRGPTDMTLTGWKTLRRNKKVREITWDFPASRKHSRSMHAVVRYHNVVSFSPIQSIA